MEFGLAIICHSCDNACWLQAQTRGVNGTKDILKYAPFDIDRNGLPTNMLPASHPTQWGCHRTLGPPAGSAPLRGQPPSPSLLQNFLVCSFHGGHSCLEEALL
ncbi:unnamed protein product [Boreogadus saida]